MNLNFDSQNKKALEKLLFKIGDEELDFHSTMHRISNVMWLSNPKQLKVGIVVPYGLIERVDGGIVDYHIVCPASMYETKPHVHSVRKGGRKDMLEFLCEKNVSPVYSSDAHEELIKEFSEIARQENKQQSESTVTFDEDVYFVLKESGDEGKFAAGTKLPKNIMENFHFFESEEELRNGKKTIFDQDDVEGEDDFPYGLFDEDLQGLMKFLASFSRHNHKHK